MAATHYDGESMHGGLVGIEVPSVSTAPTPQWDYTVSHCPGESSVNLCGTTAPPAATQFQHQHLHEYQRMSSVSSTASANIYTAVPQLSAMDLHYQTPIRPQHMVAKCAAPNIMTGYTTKTDALAEKTNSANNTHSTATSWAGYVADKLGCTKLFGGYHQHTGGNSTKFMAPIIHDPNMSSMIQPPWPRDAAGAVPRADTIPVHLLPPLPTIGSSSTLGTAPAAPPAFPHMAPGAGVDRYHGGAVLHPSKSVSSTIAPTLRPIAPKAALFPPSHHRSALHHQAGMPRFIQS